jgi:uncharacterized protein (TIGR03084 family)
MESICNDLEAETSSLVCVLDPLTDEEWDSPTPAAGWSIRDQISHLTFFDLTGRLAATDPEAFAANARELITSNVGGDAGVVAGRALPVREVLDQFIAARASMIAVFRTLDPKARLPWYGPPMGALSFATARLMETWAHGQDIVDAVGGYREPSARLRHVAHIGVRARPFAYAINNRQLPDGDVAVRLSAPDGDVWTWNDSDSPGNLVEGPALDFCLVVTQRRHIDDTALRVSGPNARDWMPIAQAFAGAPGPGRPRLQDVERASLPPQS